MEEVGEDDVEVEEAVRLALLLMMLLLLGIGSGEVEVGEGAAGGGEEGVEGVLVGRHRDGAGGGGCTRWRGGSRRAAACWSTGGGPLSPAEVKEWRSPSVPFRRAAAEEMNGLSLRCLFR